MAMTTREILEYIRKREAEGISDTQIDDELMEKGITEEELDEANDLYCTEYVPVREE